MRGARGLDRALAFERLHVRRMPGFAHGGFELDGLSAGINVVHGPNASGKTTTARALQALLWPSRAPQTAWLRGAVRVGGEAWTVELEAGGARWQREGQDATAPVLPPVDCRDRYFLSLHDLLAVDDGGLAVAIARESAGGYDVAGAARALGMREPNLARAARGERRALDEARRRLREAQERQAALRREEEGLAALRRRRDEAAAAERQVRLLECAVACVEAEAAEREAGEALKAFPAGMAALREDDADRLAELRGRQRGVAGRLRDAESARDRARGEVEAAALPAAGLPERLLPELYARLQEVQAAEREVAAAEQRLAEARRVREEERRRIGAAVEDARLAALDAVGVDELADFAEEAERVAAEWKALMAERGRLGGEEAPADLDAVRDGIRLLSRWLAVDARAVAIARRARAALLAAVMFGLVAVAVLGALVHPAAFALLPVPLLLALAARGDGGSGEARAAYRRDFEALGLGAPERWEEGAVRRLAEELERRLAEGRLAEQRAVRRGEVERLLKELEPRRAELEARRAELIARFGVAPDTAAPVLSWLANRISRWQDADGDVAGAEAALAAGRSSAARSLEAARALLAGYGYEDIAAAAALEGAIRALDRRRERHAAAHQALENAESGIEAARREAAQLAGDVGALLDRLGLGPEDDALVAAWCAKLGEYRAAAGRLERARVEAAAARRALEAEPAYAPELVAGTAAELRARLEEARQVAAERERLAEAVGALEMRIDTAGRAHEVEDALAEVERAETELADARERDVRAAVGAVLVAYVQQATRDHDRPAVFHRARELFARFTRGRYRLDLDAGEPPAFRAFDAVDETGRALDELSSATRVQLLLAVRMAFVEVQEQGLKLPLVLDEALGNSDDVRAHAIVEAVAALAAEGRQIFYLTAQADEVAKWRAFLAGRDEVPHAFVGLAEARRLPAEERLPVVAARAHELPEVPAPAGHDHASYGAVLGVPRLDVCETPIGAVHLWYLIDDPERLHGLLQLGVRTWGELETLARFSSEPGPVIGEALEEARAGARVLETLAELRRIGRGRPVDRQVLVDSGAISARFLDRVADLAASLGGDAARLVAALEEGRLPHFRSEAARKLREYLEEHGYLDANEPLTIEEIRARVLAGFGADVAAGRLTPARLERLLQLA